MAIYVIPLFVSIQKTSETNMIRASFSSLLKDNKIILPLAFVLLSILTAQPATAKPNPANPYMVVTGLADLRSTFSDGTHSIEELVQMAESRGFKVVFINDHDRIALSYGVPPFRRILRYKKEFPSIMTHGPEKFLKEIKRLSKKFPNVIIIPGCITSAYYYWTGSWLKKNLTVHEYDRRVLIFDFNKPEDYAFIPNPHNKLSLKYTKERLPGLVIFVIPLLMGFILTRWKGFYRWMGIFLIIFSVLAIMDYNPFRSCRFSTYEGDQGIAPFQELIDYVNERGGLCFWNYPEQRSGIRKYGPIRANTPPYPQVLHQSRNYTGFAAIYGENVTVTDPGKEWDRVLNEYCRGERHKPAWGISTADFHMDGHSVRRLGAYPTTFLIREFSKRGVLEAMEKGRMYCSLGKGNVWPKLDYFNVLGNAGEKAFMGETSTTSRYPVIKFRVSYDAEKPIPLKILLIRGGTVLHTFKGMTPMEMEYTDDKIPPNKKTYYRLIDSKKHLTSNPIFMTYKTEGL
ncbi:MAG: hypothetical protein PVH99_15800 [Desulfobacteraceae bacterium]|jgi:hypothetical protein